MPLNIVPPKSFESEVNALKYGQKAHELDLPDTLQTGKGPLSVASEINNRHPLENRVKNWEKTQNSTRLETLNRIFGASEPIRQTMALQIVDQTELKPSALQYGNYSNLHKDILTNKEASLDWEDVYNADYIAETDGFMLHGDIHREMETKLGI